MSELRLRADVTLVPLAWEHAERMLRWVQAPSVAQGLGLRDAEPTLAKTQAWIQRTCSDPALRAFAILQESEHVGVIYLDRLDTHLQLGRLTVYLGPTEVRGQGVGTTAVYRLCEVGFHALALHKIWLTVHDQNLAAIAVYRRCGFVHEGTLREEFRLANTRVDALYFGLLRSDFEQLSVQGGAL